MARSAKRTIFGIHSISFYNRQTKLPYGMLEVLGNGTFEMAGEQIKLKGGSNKFDWAVEQGNIESSINLTTKEYPDFLIALLLGKTPTPLAASALGTISGFKNVKGTSIQNATNGISAVIADAGNEGNLKFGKYVLKALSADEVALYCLSNVDFARGTDVDFLTDDLEVVATEEITVGANDLVGLGLSFTGVGAPAFVVGDTATFDVLPPHEGASEVVIGGLTDSFPAFGCAIIAQKSSTGELFEIDCPNVSGSGLNLGGAEKAFTETPVTLAVAYDSSLGGIAKMRMCKSVVE